MKDDFYRVIKDDPSWQDCLHYFTNPRVNVHLAIMVEPFLSAILNGQKTVESRFSKHKIAPYQKANPGDLVLLKRSSGPIVGSFEVGLTDYFTLTPEVLKNLETTYHMAIAASAEFWQAQQTKHYATFLGVKNVQPHSPKPIYKKDPRAWIVL